MILSYYPGCSLKTSSSFFEASLKKVFAFYRIDLREIDDWSCCGASAASTVNEGLSYALAARNLALAESDGRHMLAPCSACYSRSYVTNEMIRNDARIRGEVNEAIAPLACLGMVEVKNIIEAFHEYVGIERIAKDRAFDVSGLRVVAYYGCVLTRMMKTKPFDDRENPGSMDTILEALGAQVIWWPYKMECCGAGRTITDKDLTFALSGRIMDRAITLGADAIVTSCPLCQLNLDLLAFSGRERNLPVLFLTEMFELALFGKIAGADSHLIKTDGMMSRMNKTGRMSRIGKTDERDDVYRSNMEYIVQHDPEGAERLERILSKRDTLRQGNVYGERFTHRQVAMVLDPLLEAAFERAMFLECLADGEKTVPDLAGEMQLEVSRIFDHAKELLRRNLIEISGYRERYAIFRRKANGETG